MQLIKLRRVVIRNCTTDDENFTRLYRIFSKTLCPGMSFRFFKGFYYSTELDYIDVTFIYVGEVLIGFCAAAFYITTINKERHVVGRAAIGILPGVRGKKLPVRSLYAKYMWYKSRHPFIPLTLTAYVANPFVYAMICKYTGIVYPRMTTETPPDITLLKKGIIHHSGLEKKEHSPFVVHLHFEVSLGESTYKQILESENVYVKYYIELNPDFMKQNGVMVIIPVTWINIMQSAGRLFKRLPLIRNFIGKKGIAKSDAENDKKMSNFQGKIDRDYNAN